MHEECLARGLSLLLLGYGVCVRIAGVLESMVVQQQNPLIYLLFVVKGHI